MASGALNTALFVDAGYVLAAGGLLFCSSWRRDEIGCDYAGLLSSLAREVERREPDSRLVRMYWYDGAVDGRASYEQVRIGHLPYVKLRLGRLAKGAQKGVDAMICLDLLTLSQRRAIDRAYLLSGDEDLGEAVCEAQRYGVQVELLTVPTPEGQQFNLSAQLAGEADALHTLPESFWEPYFQVRDRASEAPCDELVAQARELGQRFARTLAQERPEQELERLLAAFPSLPHQTDIELLSFAERSMGSLRRAPDLKTELRGQFWFALKADVRARRAFATLTADSDEPERAGRSADRPPAVTGGQLAGEVRRG